MKDAEGCRLSEQIALIHDTFYAIKEFRDLSIVIRNDNIVNKALYIILHNTLAFSGWIRMMDTNIIVSYHTMSSRIRAKQNIYSDIITKNLIFRQ